MCEGTKKMNIKNREKGKKPFSRFFFGEWMIQKNQVSARSINFSRYFFASSEIKRIFQMSDFR